ncbi:nitrate reductase subunit alpha [Natronospira bacteriovora]|uniref:nitrate reductase (quinone) n=1 Tax=Natronospira bacteriovora TaxID=3069753 RepID=A0ABU0W3L2_9GAMM|nr:nitrate reductase subunit alpha [Natronospira sp. AB-CW4]MDQ2068599.1 nitrate reductase subunit alpha [Natronospira sp. AB-CW4]
MSHFLDNLTFFRREKETFSEDHGVKTDENRRWEDSYRARWQHDRIVRSTHGVNCTGSCSWKIYVKNGLVTWETQQTDYPRTRPGLPNHEPRGCARGASYSWYIYSANRVKYPMIRRRLLELWREAKQSHSDPVNAWQSIVEDPEKARSYKSRRGLGGFLRADWNEVNEIIAAANVYTAKQFGPDRIIGFSPIPAMSMVSYAAGTRYLSLIGGTCMSFYDWYCDLPPASPQTWGEQTDVPESADWFNSTFLMMWGSNVPQTRTPDAHYMTEARYRGTKTVTVTPDYSEASKFGDIWLNPKQGTDSALAMAMGHVILREWHVDGKSEYFDDYVRRYTDLPGLVMLDEQDGRVVPGRYLRASDLDSNMGQENNPEWKTLVRDEKTGNIVVPRGSIGFRWGEEDRRWNLETLDADGKEIRPQLSEIDSRDEVVTVAFPYFGGGGNAHWSHTEHDPIQLRNVPARKVKLADGSEVSVATVFDLMVANYGIDRGLGGGNVAASYDDDIPYTPAWQEAITGVPREKVIAVAQQFAENAHKTRGKSMIIIGAAMNHWYHMDMNYRGVIKMLMMCGCIGVSGGGWAHYVGQEKLRPQPGWTPLAFALDWNRPPRHMNSTSFFYNHTSQWRHEKLEIGEVLSPLAKAADFQGHIIDFNVRAERMGWLPSAPQLSRNPLEIGKAAKAAGQEPKDYVVEQLKSGDLGFACEDPDNPANFPRNMFVWRSNLLGSSGKGHEYFLKYLLGTENGLQNKDLGEETDKHPQEVKWREAATGKLDLLTTLDFRMSTTCMYSDIVLPTATWYEKDDLNTSDMHPFIHPLTAAVDPAWESRSDWDIYKGIARRFSELVPGHLGTETDVVTLPLLHDSPAELAQALDVKDWKKGECEPIPGKTMPNIVPVERDYPATYERFTALGPLMEKAGNNGKGMQWDTSEEVQALRDLNGVQNKGSAKGQPKIETAVHAAEMILMLAPETNGKVAMKSWQSLSEKTGREHTHLVAGHAAEKIRFNDLKAQPRKIFTSPTWSGIESEKVSYNAGWTNVNELIPWRTLTGRQQFYQDHLWMRAFGEQLCVYKPPVDLKTTDAMEGKRSNGNKEVVLNFITPHQKWGIHSTYTDNLLMLTLSRGGPIIWISEVDAAKADIKDNDWIEAFNINGAITARAVVSQRVPEGMSMMYHAQEKIVNTPGSEITGMRGGIHNSVTRAVLKPTHMIGGYAQQSYFFNYHGTVGANRDEFIIVRKMDKVDWMDNDDVGDAMYVEAAK